MADKKLDNLLLIIINHLPRNVIKGKVASSLIFFIESGLFSPLNVLKLKLTLGITFFLPLFCLTVCDSSFLFYFSISLSQVEPLKVYQTQ